MSRYLLFLLPAVAQAATLPPAPFPVFLKAGFSSVLEFEDAPTRVVLGDAQSFQVEKLDRSLVVKTLAPYAASNMFVYFSSQPPRLFVLTASEDAEPTYYKKFENPALPKPDRKPETQIRPADSTPRGGRVTSAKFDGKKDYLTVEAEIMAGSTEIIRPNWSLIRLRLGANTLVPYKLWAEREAVQKDARVKTRLIFAKPNLPLDLRGVNLVVPIQGSATPLSLPLRGAK